MVNVCFLQFLKPISATLDSNRVKRLPALRAVTNRLLRVSSVLPSIGLAQLIFASDGFGDVGRAACRSFSLLWEHCTRHRRGKGSSRTDWLCILSVGSKMPSCLEKSRKKGRRIGSRERERERELEADSARGDRSVWESCVCRVCVACTLIGKMAPNQSTSRSRCRSSRPRARRASAAALVSARLVLFALLPPAPRPNPAVYSKAVSMTTSSLARARLRSELGLRGASRVMRVGTRVADWRGAEQSGACHRRVAPSSLLPSSVLHVDN